MTELLLFGTRGKNARTLSPGRSQVNFLATQKREHSRKPDEIFPIIEACSPGPRLELFAREKRKGWTIWGNQAPEEENQFTGPTHGVTYRDKKAKVIHPQFDCELRLFEGEGRKRQAR